MTKKLRFRLIVIFTICFAFCLASFLSSLLKVNADEKFYVADVFISDDVNFVPVENDPDGQSSENGLKMTFVKSGAEVKITNNFIGDFSLSYVPLKNEGNYTFKKLRIGFEDVEDKSGFDLVLIHNDGIQAYVEIEGKKAGLFYENNQLKQLTRIANSNGQFTSLNSNIEYGIRFDAATFCVYAGEKDNEVKVWDLSVTSNDNYDIGAALSNFNQYAVTLTMEDVSATAAGEAIFYSINNLSLDKVYVNQTGGATVFSNIKTNGLTGELYFLPEIYAVDFFSDKINIAYEVYDPSGDKVIVNYKKFTPKQAGEYIFKITAVNYFGETTVVEKTIRVYDEVPNYTYASVGDLIPTEVKTGAQVYIPDMKISGGLNSDNNISSATLTIYKNGYRRENYVDVNGGFWYEVPAQPSTYTLIYDVYGEKVEYTFHSVNVESELVDYKVLDSVTLNDEIDFTNARFLVNGESVEYDFQVIAPSGKIFKNKYFTASEEGEYTVYANAIKDNVKYVDTVTFTALLKSQDLFIGDSFSSTSYATSNFSGRNGVKVTATSSNATVTYSKEINISEYVNQTKLNENNRIVPSDNAKALVELAVEAPAYMQRATSEMTITLTDKENSNKYLTISLRADTSTATTYVKVGGNGQNLSGFENLNDNSTKKEVKLNNIWGKLWYSGGAGRYYGFSACHTMCGTKKSNVDIADATIKLYWDNEKKQLLCNPYALDSWLVSDIDDKKYFNDFAWEGFESDNVILTVNAGTINSGFSKVEYMLYQIDGHSLGEDYTEYRCDPTIEVVDSVFLYGLKDREFTLPAATAKDLYGQPISVITKVYYLKNDERYDINTINGKFVPKWTGNYIISYIAVDYYGNRTCEEKSVSISEKPQTPMELSFIGDISSYETSKTGVNYAFLPIENIDVHFNYSEPVSYTIEKFVYEEGNENNAIAITEATHLFEKSGHYKVKYVITDAYNEQATISYDLEVALNENCISICSAVPYYVGATTGMTIDILDLFVKDYSQDNPERRKADVYVNGDLFNGDVYTISEYVDKVNQAPYNESLLIEYKYGDLVVYSYNLPVVSLYQEVEKRIGNTETYITETQLKMDRLFVSEEMTISANMTGIKATAVGMGEIAYRSPLNIVGFTTSFSVEKCNQEGQDNNIEKILLKLTDAYDKDNVVVIEFVLQTDGAVRAYLNGNSKVYYDCDFDLQGIYKNSFTLKFNDSNNTFYDGNGYKMFSVDALGGESFKGFSEYVYLSFAIYGQNNEKDVSIIFNAVNGQSLSDNTKDVVAPNIIIEKSIGGVYLMTDTFTLPKAYAYDVLNKLKSFSVSVKNTDTNEYVTDVNGVVLNKVSPTNEYMIQFNKVGYYSVVYEATDSKNNGEGQSITYSFIVTSSVKPVITLSEEIPVTMSVGTETSIPAYTVSYAYQSDENVSFVRYVAPSYKSGTITDGKFTPEEKGPYKIIYVAVDSLGNYTIEEYKVECR